MFKSVRFVLAAVAAGLFFLSAPVSASEVILTVDGKIGSSRPVDMSIEDLEALEPKTIVTKTPWHEGDTTFEGVLFADLIDHLGATGETLSVAALNNYYSEIPVEDLRRFGVILAYKQDGAYMPVSDKGPLFVVYPFDEHPELQNEVYYARSAWQVRSITVE
ncbi:MAG: molybdopterin-dependent oxidoreductase [Hoeflea sp.]|uniref:molybdopterin-dependent oxidoreductase n=1 Tax=Hoeflea sp. TaxID=1940281 RepID=UPI0032F0911B